MKSIIEPNRVYQIKSETVHFSVRACLISTDRVFRSATVQDARNRDEGLARIIHHSRGASLGIRYHSAFASLTNTTSIRSVTENAVITNTVAIHALSGELSRLEI